MSNNKIIDHDLDTSWIEKEEKLYSAETNLYKEPMDSILCYFIYVGKDSSIQKIIKRNETLSILNENGENGIHSDRILQMIQTSRILSNGLKYKITSLSRFLVDLEHDSLYDYAYNDNENNHYMSRGFFKELSFLEKIVIEPSLSIFHALSSLYFIFKEDAMVKKSIKSILKIEGSSENIKNSRSTKKVRIFEEKDSDAVTSLQNKVRKTRKNT